LIQLNRYCGDELTLSAAGVPDGVDALIVTRAARQRYKAGKSGRVMFVARDDRFRQAEPSPQGALQLYLRC